MEKMEFKSRITRNEIEEFRKECLTKIHEDEEFYSLIKKDFSDEEIESNIAKFSKYHSDYLLNKEVKTYAECKKINKFFWYTLIKVDGRIEISEREMDGYSNFVSYKNHFICADFDLDEYYGYKLTQLPRKELAVLIKDRAKSKANSFYIHGSSGTFKTSAAIAMCNGYILNKDYFVCFLNTFKRFAELSEFYFSKSNKDLFLARMKTISEAKVLVLDGLGEEYKNEIVRDVILIPILRERSKNKDLITIYTSEYTLDEIVQMYSLKDKNDFISRKIKEYISIGMKMPIDSGSFSI